MNFYIVYFQLANGATQLVVAIPTKYPYSD